jgi:rRNA processing protein Krr1/Pno1
MPDDDPLIAIHQQLQQRLRHTPDKQDAEAIATAINKAFITGANLTHTQNIVKAIARGTPAPTALRPLAEALHDVDTWARQYSPQDDDDAR